MLAYTLKRLGLAILVALFVSALAFALLRLSGDPALAIAGEGAREADIELVRKTYGLDRPLPVQYLDWLRTMLQRRPRPVALFQAPTCGAWSPTSCR